MNPETSKIPAGSECGQGGGDGGGGQEERQRGLQWNRELSYSQVVKISVHSKAIMYRYRLREHAPSGR